MFKVLKGKDDQPQILHAAKVLNYKREIKISSAKSESVTNRPAPQVIQKTITPAEIKGH